MTIKNIFTLEIRKEIERYLISAIDKDVMLKNDVSEYEIHRLQKYKLIKIFIDLTELDVKDLKQHGRYTIHPNFFAARLGERFNTILRINSTPSRNNYFCKTLYLCLLQGGAIKEGTEVERYAKAGIDLNNPAKNPNKINSLFKNEKI